MLPIRGENLTAYPSVTLRRTRPLSHRELVRVTAFVSHAFEDFTLADPSCGFISHDFHVWLMYGGTGSRSKPLTVEDMSIPLVRTLRSGNLRTS